jgi:hypothetical protein
MKPTARLALALPLFALLAACGAPPVPQDADGAPTSLSEAPPAPPGAASASAAPLAAPRPDFRGLVTSLSEPDKDFISDNIISNETSYLQPAEALAKASGGAYIGVGPEQNFTYIALSRPSVAFIVDIRRQNLVEHLLYRAIFGEATSRAHFLALLVGRPYEAAGDPGPAGSIEAVIAHAEQSPPDEATFKVSHARLLADIDVPLDAADRKALMAVHRSFFKGQLDVRFELRPPSGRAYPKLRELLSARDPGGAARGFLASEEAFRFVQAMEREGRVIPVVGDFAGDHALPGIAAYLRKEKIDVSAFYVSNVEQYLFEPGVWAKWARNVAALPVNDRSVFVRAYLDQGRRHPEQMKGHRAATVLQRIADFDARQEKKPYASFWEVATDASP